MKKKVMISAPYFQPVVDSYRALFDSKGIELIIPRVEERLGEDDLLRMIADIDGVICGDDVFTVKVLKAAKKLKVISKWGTGIDSIDHEACKVLGIAVRNTPNAFTEAVADSIMAYTLAFARNIISADREMKKGLWKKIPGAALNEKVLGIIGVGNIGAAVAKRAAAFGIRIMGNDVKTFPAGHLAETGIEWADKDTVYREADFISINCDLNATSRHLVDLKAFKKMKPSAYLINTARGPIVKEDDLIKALEEKMIAGAALDVFEDEPLPKDSPLLKMDNVLLAPHNSNSSPKAWDRVHQNTVNNLLEVLNES